ncbi:MAG: DNA methylase [Rhodocyclaceae bacterium]|nr:MAG: DNA methylase [Rhodocyclaceae bacterium]
MKNKKNSLSDAIKSLYETPLPSSRTGPLYNAFSYPTKISPEAIAVFIATHTKPGATVLDAFGGSGTTGLAAMLCDRPTETMRKMAAEMGVAPEWGPRNAHLFEIGKLGSFVARTLCSPPDPEVFSKAVDKLCQQAQMKIGRTYAAKDPSGQDGVIRHAIWSDVLVCPDCGNEITYWEAAVRHSPLSMSDSFVCGGCDKTFKIDSCERAFETVTDAFGEDAERKKRVLARVYGKTGKTKWQRPPSKEDMEIFAEAENEPLPASAPNAELVWGDLHRAGYHKGIKRLHHFYTHRNFLAVATLWELAGKFPTEIRDALRLLVLSYNSSHSTLMTRVVVKKGQNDLVLTGSQSGVLYISGLPVEKNVIEGVARKAKAFKEAFALLHGSSSKVEVHNRSSEQMGLPDVSVDYVFTDPPFGDYIPYAEINQINEIWLGETTDRTKEIIVSEAQKKGVGAYGKMMGNVFGEISRVLKPEGAATVVFHSAHSEIWRALVSAYGGAGLSVAATSVLDKIQASFKQVVSEVSVKGDPLLLLVKETNDTSTAKSCRKIAEEIVAEEACDDQQMLYSRFVGRCLEAGAQMDMDAREFYALAKEMTEVRV